MSTHRLVSIPCLAACLCCCMATPELKTTSSDISMALGKSAHLVTAVALSPDGRYAATRNMALRWAPDNVMLWDIAAGAPVRSFDGPKYTTSRSFSPRKDVAFSPDSRYLAIAGQGLRIWDIPEDKEARTIGEVVDEFAFSKDWKQVLIYWFTNVWAARDHLTLWDFRTGKQIGEFVTAQVPRRASD